MSSSLAGAPAFDVRAMLAGFAALGLDPETLCAEAHLNVETLGDPEGRIPGDTLERLWKAAEGHYTGHSLGLAAGLAVPFGAYEVIDFLAASCETVGEGLTHLARYLSLVTSSLSFEISRQPSGVRVALQSIKPIGVVLPRWFHYTWAISISRFRAIGHPALTPESLSLPGPKPADAERFAEAFGCPVTFGSSESVALFSEAAWGLPLQRADSRLKSVLDRHACDLLDRLPKNNDLSESLRRALLAELRAGPPTLEAVGKRLGISPRTLQRRLSEASLSFAEVLDELRQELAVEYLHKTELAVAEIGYLVGYADTTSFHRAFKRWTGTTPALLRAGPTS